MSIAIMRVQKVKGASGVAGTQIHNRREREHSNTNPDIDHQRSNNNYSIKSTSGSFNQFITQRITAGYKGSRAIRKDAVLMCDALFTSDQEFFSTLPPERQREFFQTCYDWAIRRWGSDNIISAVVHLDETTPHMHLDFVPLTKDGRLSAKSVLGGQKELQQLQDDFFEKVGKQYGLERGNRANIDAGERGQVHLTTKEAKKKELAKLDNQVKSSEKALKRIQSRVFETKEEIQEINKNAKKTLTGGLKGVSWTDWEKMINTASYVEQERKKRKRTEKDNEKLKTEVNDLKKQLEAKDSEKSREVFNLKARVQERDIEQKQQLSRVENKLEFYRKALKPETVQKIEAAYQRQQNQQRKKGLTR